MPSGDTTRSIGVFTVPGVDGKYNVDSSKRNEYSRSQYSKIHCLSGNTSAFFSICRYVVHKLRQLNSSHRLIKALVYTYPAAVGYHFTANQYQYALQ